MTRSPSNLTRVSALAAWAGDPAHEYAPESIPNDRHAFTGPGRSEWLVLTDAEADAATAEYVAESLWAFNASFLAEQTDLPALVFHRLSGMCDAANDAIRAMVEKTCGLEDFTSEAIASDGRGHFLAGYDGEEVELSGGKLYAYRTN